MEPNPAIPFVGVGAIFRDIPVDLFEKVLWFQFVIVTSPESIVRIRRVSEANKLFGEGPDFLGGYPRSPSSRAIG